MSEITWDSRGRLTIDGVLRFPTGIYDSNLVGNNFATHIGPPPGRDYARFRFDMVLHVTSGTFSNGIKLIDAIRPLNMYGLAVANWFGNFSFDPAFFDPAAAEFDFQRNPNYTFPPDPSLPFRTMWNTRLGAMAVYAEDEPHHHPVGWYGGTANDRVVGGRFDSNIASAWGVSVNGGGNGAVTWVSIAGGPGANGGGPSSAGAAQIACGTSTSVDLIQVVTGLTPGQQTKFFWRLKQGGPIRVRCLDGGTTLVDRTESVAGVTATAGPYWDYITPSGTSVSIIFTVTTGVTAAIDDVGISRKDGDPPPLPASRGIDCCVFNYNTYKSWLPQHPVWVTYLNDSPYQYREWGLQRHGDIVGSDIYVIGQGPELNPASGATLDGTYGYMNFAVAEAAALGSYYAQQFARSPVTVLQANKFGNTSRYQTREETLSHYAICLTEHQGAGMIVWWSMGTQNGALEQTFTTAFAGNGSQTVFQPTIGATGALPADDVDQVQITIDNVLQPQSAYTLQNLGNRTLVRIGNFWQWEFPVQVTMNTPPAAGTTLRMIIAVCSTAMRNMVYQFLEDATKFQRANESIFLQTPDPNFIVSNSTKTDPDYLTWRRNHVNGLRNFNGNKGPCWVFGAAERYTDEWNKLNLNPPDTSLSVHMQWTWGNVRAVAWVGPTYALVTGYNINPEAQNNVQFTFNRTCTRCEVVFENRDIILTNNGRTLTDTFGGASSLRQGPFSQGHIYKLYFGDVAPIKPSRPGCGVGFRNQVISNAG